MPMNTDNALSKGGIYLVLISIHGLIRGKDLELGRDADTGGQTKYVVELAKALGEHPDVERVDLLTRLVIDPQVSADYAKPGEPLSGKARIVRIACGENGYLFKEDLWDDLDVFADNALAHINAQQKLPDVIHSHYADAGYVGTSLSNRLGIPLVHTGHSLGRSKRRRLLASGLKRTDIEQRYKISRRIEAEEATLGLANLVITSTNQEIEEQYGLYDHYQPTKMRVVPPGTDLTRFFPPEGTERKSDIAQEVMRFLREPEKPLILALSRPDQRKNISALVAAYGENAKLQEQANLVIIAGNRDDIRDMESGAQEVLQDILLTIDQYDLYGRIAYPKHHKADDVPTLYRLAALSKGVFVNPALTEPFGLTLIEAAASGLPIVATEDGGPVDIIRNCENGYLIDPLDKQAISETLGRILAEHETWNRLSENGIKGVRKHYAWSAHAEKYLSLLHPIISEVEPPARMCLKRRPMLYHDRAIFTDLDQSLLGDREALQRFIELVRTNRRCVSFGIATGRRLDSALSMLKRFSIPQPDVLITSQGTEIYYAPNLTRDTAWSTHISHLWNPKVISGLLEEIPGLRLQPKSEQSSFKISYYIDPSIAPDVNEITRLLHQHDQTANVTFAFGQFLDIVPIRASKGQALRWFSDQWDVPLEHILAAGGSGGDEDMMRGNTLAVVVANRHEEELSELTDIEKIYFAGRPYADGIIEAIDYYDFLQSCGAPRP